MGLLSIHDVTTRLAPAGVQVARLASRPLSSASVPQIGIIPKHRVEGGHRPVASGAPATRGAHNSETLVQQPDHQSLVRESIPSQVTEALPVDAFRGPPSRRISA